MKPLKLSRLGECLTPRRFTTLSHLKEEEVTCIIRSLAFASSI